MDPALHLGTRTPSLSGAMDRLREIRQIVGVAASDSHQYVERAPFRHILLIDLIPAKEFGGAGLCGKSLVHNERVSRIDWYPALAA